MTTNVGPDQVPIPQTSKDSPTDPSLTPTKAASAAIASPLVVVPHAETVVITAGRDDQANAAPGAPAPRPQAPSSNGAPDPSARTSAAPPVGVAEALVPSAPSPTPASDPNVSVAGRQPSPRPVVHAANGQSFAGALLMLTPSLPLVATIASVLIYASPESARLVSVVPFVKQNPVVAGFGIAIMVALVGAAILHRLTGSTSADQANAAEYSQLLRRVGALDARLAVLRLGPQPLSQSQQIALSQAETYRQQIDARLAKAGIEWVVATGYVSLWSLLHAAEEALLLVDPVEDVVRAALYDDMRIQGSALGTSSDLQAKLRLAVVRLQPDAAAYFTQPPGASPVAAQAPAAADARAVVADVRENINEFRDENRGALVRSRAHLQATVTLTGLATFVALGLALSGRSTDAPVDMLTDSILSAATFFLVGAMIGLFNRLSNETTNDTSIEDYGLSTERMRLTPVLSGLAALAGVVVVAMLPAVLNNSVFSLVSTSTGSASVPMLYQVYSLSGNPMGVIFAAIFGLTPGLPLGALQAAGERYRANLKSTTASPTA